MDVQTTFDVFIRTGLPIVYALLSDRKAATYVHLFSVLFEEAKRMDKRFDPHLITTDFEPGIAKAITLEVD
jgi:hypothetical protein